MRKLGIAVSLVLCLGVLGVAVTTPSIPCTNVTTDVQAYSAWAITSPGLLVLAQAATVPCTRVAPGGPGSYIVWVQNTTAKNLVEFNLVFAVEATVDKAIGVNGTAHLAIQGSGQVWNVKMAGAGVRPGGFVLVSTKASLPAQLTKPSDLVLAAFPVDPTAAASYIVEIKNATAKALVEFRIVFTADVTVNRAFDNSASVTVTGDGQVWAVKLDGAGLAVGGSLFLSVTPVVPVTVKVCADLVRVVFPF